MKELALLLISCLLIVSCSLNRDPGKEVETIEAEIPEAVNLFDDTIPIPEGYKIKAQALGYLTNDYQMDRLVVFQKMNPETKAFDRILHIYFKENGQWKLSETIQGPIMSSDEGGVWGDPYGSVEIKDKTILISHYGGSRHKWAYSHYFNNKADRPEGKWQLQMVEIVAYDNDEYYDFVSYNLKTGAIQYEHIDEIYNEEYELISSDTTKGSYNVPMENLPLMHEYIIGDHELVLPEVDKTFSY